MVTGGTPTVNNGDHVQVTLTSSASYNTPATGTVTIGGVSGTYTVTTAQDATKPTLSVTCPDATQVVGTATVSFVNGTANDDSGSVSVTLSRSGATAATIVSAPGSFAIPDQALAVGDNSFVFTASDGVNTTTLTCNVYRTPDTTAATFTLTPETGATRSTEYTSNTVTVSGLEVSVPVSVTAGRLIVNNAEVASTGTTVKNGDTVQIKLTSSPSYNTDVSSILTIGVTNGGVWDTYIITTGPDTTAPTVSLAASSNSFTAAGSVTLTATAADDVGVSRVEFYEGGTLLSTASAGPYISTITYAFTDNGSHSYTAKAFDAAGNVAASSPATTVTVAIPVPVISSLTPTSGLQTGGYTFTLTGTNLTGGQVKFGAADVADEAVNAQGTQITGTVPAGTAGSVGVTVSTSGGTSGPTTFTYGLTVTSSADSGDGSLRSVVSGAAPGDAIFFAPSVSTITLGSQIILDKNLTITGAVTLNGGGGTRMFDVPLGVSVTLRQLTITNGFAWSQGGAISNMGTLELEGVTISNSRVLGSDGAVGSTSYSSYPYGAWGASGNSGNTAYGGAIYNGATLNLIRVTIMNNSASGGNGGRGGDGFYGGEYYSGGWGGRGGDAGSGYGGGIYNEGNLSIVDSQVSNNRAAGGFSMGGNGGAGGYLITTFSYRCGLSTCYSSSRTDYNGGNGGDGGISGSASGGGIFTSNPAFSSSGTSYTNNAVQDGYSVGGRGGEAGGRGASAGSSGRAGAAGTATSPEHN
ncbi:Ig-like domain-containing protein [Deinococcus frigens]